MSFLPYPPASTTAAIEVFRQDVGLTHEVVHGSDTATVLTEGGEIPTINKLLKDLNDRIGTGTGADVTLRPDLAAVNSNILVGGALASTLSYDVLKYGAVQDLSTAGSENTLAFLDALAASRHVTAKDGVYYVSDTIDVNSYHDLNLPACSIVCVGMTGKPLFRFRLEAPTIASEQISIKMGGGTISGDASYVFEFVSVDTAPSVAENCRIIKIDGVTVSSITMRFAKATNAAKSLFFTNVWHFGGMFLDTNGKVVETHISNCLIFGSGADTNGFLMESNGGASQYSEGLHITNCTIDGYLNCCNIRDLFVLTVVGGYIGGTNSFLFRQPTTTHNREHNIGGSVVLAGKIIYQDASGGTTANAKLNNLIFAGASAPVVEIGTGWSAIDINDIKAETNGGSSAVAILVKNGCNDINIDNVNSDNTFNGAVEFVGSSGDNCRAINVNAKVGKSVTTGRVVIVKNPSLDGINDIALHRYSARIPTTSSTLVGASFGGVAVSLPKGQTGLIVISARFTGCASGQTLLVDGTGDLSIPDGAGWSSAFVELSTGESALYHTIPFIAKIDIPFVSIELINSVGNSISQESSHAFISVIKDL